ncbi:MAG TPA: LPS assembly protein LptD [Thermodesulfobacteriota bacterium]
MTRRRLRRLVAAVLAAAALLGAAGRSAAAPFERFRHVGPEALGEGPVEVEADRISYDRQTGRYVLEGNVVARRGDLTLRADRVEIVPDGDVADAAGGVVIDARPDRLTADRVRINLGEQTGFLLDGELFVAQDHVTISGARIDKTGDTTYTVGDGRLTSCLCEEGAPSWSITGRRIRLSVGGYAFVQWPTLRIKGVPVFTLPYGIFPVRTERTTGLLFPRFSQSNINGWGYEQPLFIALGRSQDATLGFTYLSKRGTGATAEYRYALSETTRGIWRGSYIADRIQDRDRGDLRIRHDQILPGRFSLRADINVVSDREFPVDFGDSVEVTAQREIESRAVVERTWDDVALTGRFSVFRSLVESKPSSEVQQILPQVSLGIPPVRLEGSPIFGAIDGSLTNFYREDGVRGQRLDLFPRLIYPVALGPVATLTGQAGYRVTYYRTQEPDEEANRLLPFLGVDLKSVLGRAYEVEIGDARRLYHTIEPEVSYAFIPTSDQSDNPFFDRNDRIPRVSRVTYAIGTRLFARFAEPVGPMPPPPPRPVDPETGLEVPAPPTRVLVPPTARPPAVGATGPAREIARLLLQQSYDFGGIEGTSEERLRVGDVPAPTEQVGADRDNLSDLTARLEVRPFERFLLDFETSYDTKEGRANLVGIRTELEDERGVRLGLDYRLVEPDIEQLNGDIRVRLGRALDLLAGAKYLVQEDRLLETGYGINYRSPCDCWAIAFRAIDRIRPDETRFELLFTLVGLGSFGTATGESVFGQ